MKMKMFLIIIILFTIEAFCEKSNSIGICLSGMPSFYYWPQSTNAINVGNVIPTFYYSIKLKKSPILFSIILQGNAYTYNHYTQRTRSNVSIFENPIVVEYQIISETCDLSVFSGISFCTLSQSYMYNDYEKHFLGFPFGIKASWDIWEIGKSKLGIFSYTIASFYMYDVTEKRPIDSYKAKNELATVSLNLGWQISW